MKDYEYIYDVLLKVVKDDIPFNTAIRSVLNNGNKKIVDPNLKATIYASCGCVLRHYYVFKEVITRQYVDIDEDKLLLIALGIGNRLFAKRINEDKLLQFIAKKTGLQGAPVFIKCFDDPKNLIPDNVEYGTTKYYSLRYNIPTWVIEKWEKDNGDLIAKKLFHSLTNRPENLVRINESVIQSKDFFKKYWDFSEFNEEDGVAIFNNESTLRKHRAITEGDALKIPLSYKEMCDHLELNPSEGIAIYGCGSNYFLQELFARFGPSVKADYICGHKGHALEAKDIIKQFGLTDVTLYEKDYTMFDECFPMPVESLFVCPRSSFLLGLYERADHFLRIQQEHIKEIADKEYASLCSASKHISDGGRLIYFVTTICYDECRGLIKRFLKEEKDYVLESEKQFFPFDKYQTMFYYAILKKK